MRQRDDVLLSVERLGMGDFLVADGFVVERKTMRDFAVSVVDGRWFRQCVAMVKGERRPMIILEGTVSDCAGIHVSRDALQGALITATIFYGVPVIRSMDSAETSRVLVYLGRQAMRVANGALPRPGYRPKGKRARQSFILQGLPGIGPDRAERLLERFGSITRVATASLSDLAAIDGIGQTTATRIRWALD